MDNSQQLKLIGTYNIPRNILIYHNISRYSFIQFNYVGIFHNLNFKSLQNGLECE